MIIKYKNDIYNCSSNNKKVIKKKTNFREYLSNYIERNKVKSDYDDKVLECIKNIERNNTKITLTSVQEKYLSLFGKKLIKMILSRIMRFHLNFHFRKTSFKNPKIDKNLN